MRVLACSGAIECGYQGVTKVIKWFWAHSQAAESGCQGVTTQFLM